MIEIVLANSDLGRMVLYQRTAAATALLAAARSDQAMG
jgi:hypothetical protein